MLGADQPVILQLLEITPALDSLKGVAMELEDCAFPLLAGIEQTDDPNVAFGDVNYALLVGSRPRTKGMERKDLLEANGAIFTVQGKALAKNATDDAKILLVGNPATTNCLIAMNNADAITPERITTMTPLDHNRAAARHDADGIPPERVTRLPRLHHNRAVAHLAAEPDSTVTDVKKMTIWGSHSAPQYPDIFHAEVGGKNAAALAGDQGWLEKDFVP